MKKVNTITFLLTILSLLLSVNFIQSQIPPKNDLEEWGLNWEDATLKGQIKSINQDKYELSSKKNQKTKGRIIEDKESNDFVKYDKNGNIIEEKLGINSDLIKYTYQYDERGNKIEKNRFTPDGKLNMKYIYEYDNEGKLVEFSDLFPDGKLANKYTYKYDERSNLIEYTDYLGASLDERDVYKYDTNGNEIETIYFDSKGSLKCKWEKSYDKKGNLTEEMFYLSNGELDYKTINKYDAIGNLIEDSSRDSKGKLLLKEIIKYDNLGNKVEVNITIPTKFEIDRMSTGKMKVKTTFIYDDKGNVLEETTVTTKDFKKFKLNKKYEYDKNNNWIKRIIYLDKKPMSITERKIEYYE